MPKNLTALSFEGESGLHYHQVKANLYINLSKFAQMDIRYYDFVSSPYFNNSTVTIEEFRNFLTSKFGETGNTARVIYGFDDCSMRSAPSAVALTYFSTGRLYVTTDEMLFEEITKVIVDTTFSW